jgi:hypothetical protein
MRLQTMMAMQASTLKPERGPKDTKCWCAGPPFDLSPSKSEGMARATELGHE